jgi:hypothetical protein
VASQERVEVEDNRITRWMVRFPSGDRSGGDPLGLGFGGGECTRDPLGFGSVVVRVGDVEVVAEIFKSMMAPPSGGVEALSWLVPAPSLAGKEVTPIVQP